jgi:hypothetical protein
MASLFVSVATPPWASSSPTDIVVSNDVMGATKALNTEIITQLNSCLIQPY